MERLKWWDFFIESCLQNWEDFFFFIIENCTPVMGRFLLRTAFSNGQIFFYWELPSEVGWFVLRTAIRNWRIFYSELHQEMGRILLRTAFRSGKIFFFIIIENCIKKWEASDFFYWELPSEFGRFFYYCELHQEVGTEFGRLFFINSCLQNWDFVNKNCFQNWEGFFFYWELRLEIVRFLLRVAIVLQ